MARKRRSRSSPGIPRKTHGKGRRSSRPAVPPVRARRPKASPRRTASDALPPGVPDLRVGHGYDLHRLEALAPHGAGRPLVVGGVVLEHPDKVGPVAHSDGDVLYHALVDALLGALALPDIGQLFPNTAAVNEGRNSADFVKAAMTEVSRAGFRVLNVDATIVLEKPKLGPHKVLVRDNIAALLGVVAGRVNIKGKTHERVDAVGEGRAIEAHVVVLLVKA